MQFRQKAYRDTLDARQQWAKEAADRGIKVADSLYDTDVKENSQGYLQGERLAKDDADRFADASTAYRDTRFGQTAQQNENTAAAAKQYAEWIKKFAENAGKAVDQVAGGEMQSLPTGAMGGAAGGGGASALPDDDDLGVGSGWA